MENERWMSAFEAEYLKNYLDYQERIYIATRGWQIFTDRVKEFENNPDQEILENE